jgi:hypothetical protein
MDPCDAPLPEDQTDLGLMVIKWRYVSLHGDMLEAVEGQWVQIKGEVGRP